jgi:hypothetical protein
MAARVRVLTRVVRCDVDAIVGMVAMLRFELMRVGAVVEVAGGTPKVAPLSVRGRADSRRLVVEVTAFAEGTEGERIAPLRLHTEIAFWRHGRHAIWKRYTGSRPLPSDSVEEAAVLEQYRLQAQDVEDAVNQMFGRDPEQHQVPRSVGWQQLMMALGEEGIEVTIEELKAAPFVCELSPGLVGELDRSNGC